MDVHMHVPNKPRSEKLGEILLILSSTNFVVDTEIHFYTKSYFFIIYSNVNLNRAICHKLSTGLSLNIISYFKQTHIHTDLYKRQIFEIAVSYSPILGKAIINE